jgi:opacity protein-like surface antigen
MKKSVLFTVIFMMAGIWAGTTPCRADVWYMRGTVGYEASRAADFSDNDSAAQKPPALFGLGNGSDGNALGAYGDFGRFPELEVAFGRQFLPWLRADLAVAYRFNMNYDGQANFIGVGTNQPVSGKADSLSGMVNLFLDVNGLTGIRLGRFEPYFGGGVGLAYNRINEMTYRFPDNAKAHKFSVTPPGNRTDFAFMFAIGTGIVLNERWSLDVAYRYHDLGRVGTDPGNMAINTNPAGIAIDKTSAALRTHGAAIGLRYRF